MHHQPQRSTTTRKPNSGLAQLALPGLDEPERLVETLVALVHATLAIAASFASNYRVLVQQHGHLLHLDIARPTKSLTVQFSYGGCDIRYVNVLDYVASSRQPGLSRLPAAGPTPSIALRFDGWVMPKAGAAFVWVLEDEMTGSIDKRLAGRAMSKTPH